MVGAVVVKRSRSVLLESEVESEYSKLDSAASYNYTASAKKENAESVTFVGRTFPSN